MEPERQKTLFDEFLKKAVAEYSFVQSMLQFLPGSDPADVHRFEQLLGITAQHGGFWSLTQQQSEAALNEIIRNRAGIRRIIFSPSINLSKWLIDGQAVDTQSMISLFYGMKPCISTFLKFETTSQFEFVKQVLSELDFCKLNEKHLKPTKRELKKKVGKIPDEPAA
jgi:hypothetical protein